MGSYYPPPLYQGDRLLELMQQRGQIGQQAAQQSGEIWGGALQSLGQQAGQFVQQLGQQRDEKRVQGAVSAGMANPDAFESTISRLDPSQAAKARKAFADANEAASRLDERRSLIAQHEATLKTAQQRYQQDTADYAGTVALRTLPFLDDAPDGGLGAVGMAIQHAKSRKVPGSDQFDEPFAQAQAMLKRAHESGDPMAVEAAGEKIRQQFKPMLEQMTLGMSPEARKKLTEEQDPKLVPLPEGGLVDPRTRQVVVPGPGRKPAAVGTFEDYVVTKYGPRPTPAQTLQARKEYGQADDRPRVNVTMGGPGDASNDPEIDVAARTYNARGTLPPRSAGGDFIKAVMHRAAQLDPNANIAQNAANTGADTKSLAQLQKQTDAVAAFEQTANKNATLLRGALKDLPNVGVSFLNRPLRAGAEAFGSESMSRFNTIRQSVANEYSRIISSPGLSGTMSDSARKEGSVLLDPNATPEQIIAAMDVLAAEAKNRHASYQEQLGEIRGRMGGAAPSATPRPASNAAPQPVKIKGDAEYNALPKGAPFIGPDGILRRKP